MSSTIILITGANSGIGYAATKVIARASEKFHIIMASRSLEKVNSAKAEIEASRTEGHGQLSAVQLDVTDQNSINQAVEYVEQNFGRLDVLVNNAGIANGHPDLKTRVEITMATNVAGPMMVSAAFRPLLLKSQNPYSIYVSSAVGSLTMAADPNSPTYKGPPGGEAYRASKSALNMIALQEAVQFGSKGLKVFMMDPGFVRSNLRGTSEEARSGWGRAGDPEVSGQTMLSIIKGEQDAHVGRVVGKDGVVPW